MHDQEPTLVTFPPELGRHRWLERWVLPLLRVASLATRRPQRLSWLLVNETPRWTVREEHSNFATGVLFGSGIEQAPYEAEYREEWRRPENQPLFTLSTMPMTLPELLRRWVPLESDENPFIELYGETLRQTDLPARARFLYLVQALEALHSHQHRQEHEEAQETLAAQRPETPRELERQRVSLERRLHDLLTSLPERVHTQVIANKPAETDIDCGPPGATLEKQLATVRNQLSHGGRNYDERALKPLTRLTEIICRAHALRLLGFGPKAIEDALAPPTPAES